MRAGFRYWFDPDDQRRVELLNGGHIGHPLSSRKVAAAMRKLGFPDCHTRRGTFFRVFEIPYGSIQSALAAEVSEEESVTE